MKNIILLIFIIFCLNSCSNKKEEKVLSKSEKLTDSYFQADSELEFENEKITLISIMRGIPKDSVYLILRDYYAKNDLSFDIDSKSTENFIDTISKNRKMSKRKIASIIFNFKYEMQTKDEIEQDAIENYEDFKKDDRESEDEY
ncbi:hypothetical protein G7A72_16350 [Flavobacterium sp. Sr18]|uniref:hypothetical protein n=1 Tax=Flavobacterium sp. Sr18 TaxID=935222 RepID=UPI0013E51EDC|nr:hypothetical protein [Flavobacterium sp. Sr18]QIH40281.1 hypothetical protein G7A72_16350 [Flavobacterium sp. Sr18]